VAFWRARSRVATDARSSPLARVLRSVELVLVLSGVALLVVYAGARIHAVVGRAEALEAFEVAQSLRATEVSPAVEPGAPADVPATLQPTKTPDQSLWGENRREAYGASLGAKVGAPLGVLTIPKIDLSVPIFEGTGEIVLNRGVGRIEGTAKVGQRGNLGIAGHRDGFFRGLKDIAVGDAVDLRTLDGTVRYRVTELLIVEPSDVYVLDPTDHATLTLVTCYPFYFVGDAPQRFIVKAVPQDSPRASG
jgi:sortase A